MKQWQAFQNQAERRLQILDEATCLDDLKNLPSNHFEALRGDRKGQFSIRINLQWRVCFKWIKDEPHDVEPNTSAISLIHGRVKRVPYYFVLSFT